jgi:hypothetical protein
MLVRSFFSSLIPISISDRSRRCIFVNPHLAWASANFVRRNAWLSQWQDIRLAGYACNLSFSFEITA